MIQRILRVEYEIPASLKLSPEGRDLLARILVAGEARPPRPVLLVWGRTGPRSGCARAGISRASPAPPPPSPREECRCCAGRESPFASRDQCRPAPAPSCRPCQAYHDPGDLRPPVVQQGPASRGQGNERQHQSAASRVAGAQCDPRSTALPLAGHGPPFLSLRMPPHPARALPRWAQAETLPAPRPRRRGACPLFAG